MAPRSIEQVLQATIFPDLERGRKDFDLPHTKAVVFWAVAILGQIKESSVDPLVVEVAAYAHDWGYVGLFEGMSNLTIDEVHARKPLHMQRGGELITNLMHKQLAAEITETQQLRIAHLVRVHDLVEELVDEDEIALMEADTLGMLDLDRVTPTFSKGDNEIFMTREVRGRRLPHFTHEYARKMADLLIQKRLAFYE